MDSITDLTFIKEPKKSPSSLLVTKVMHPIENATRSMWNEF
ncbi:MAG: hypothetical protein WKF90_16275 [Pyrinomonadaceae bacterium]